MRQLNPRHRAILFDKMRNTFVRYRLCIIPNASITRADAPLRENRSRFLNDASDP
jgi:hypothetical protein